MNELSEEKKRVLESTGNVLVTANPGTGKTTLLAYKYLKLLESGVKPEDILCLTFTEKARNEMETRILKLLEGKKLKVEWTDLNIFTFHEYALNAIGEENIVSSNLLRYCIYRYLKENEVLNYSDNYLLTEIVPGMEGHVSYLKSFGITPDQIHLEQVKAQITETERYTKQELDKFAEYFLSIYQYYEESKRGKGIDYADMLLRFLALPKHRAFTYVLVDELQDVNDLEATIALKSGKTFFAVGDKKQAIFGFQGGSILNFKRFGDSTQFILGDNYRSSNEILDYAKALFLSKTKNRPEHEADLNALKNPIASAAQKPEAYSIEKDKLYLAACELARQLLSEGLETAIIARTNSQIMRASKELKSQGILHSSTFFGGSGTAKEHAIRFLRSFFSDEPEDLRAAMFTPFFPLPLSDAFALSASKTLTVEDVCAKSPGYRKLREAAKNIEEVSKVFKEVVYPVAVTYGKEYLLAAMTVENAFAEALRVLDELNLENVTAYLKSSDLLADESGQKQKLTLTTVHKAKGLEFDAVIYLPSKPLGKTDFQDNVVEAILKNKGIDATEELEEEPLRIDFVAVTRAKKRLILLAPDVDDYLNPFIEHKTMDVKGVGEGEYSERAKKAYDLFLSGDTDNAKQLLEDKQPWLMDFVKSHFEKLNHLSYSSLRTDPYAYFIDRILGIRETSPALLLGLKVHALAEQIVKNEKPILEEDVKPFEQGIRNTLTQVKAEYPEVVGTEVDIDLPLKRLTATDTEMRFKGKIDAVFRNAENYLLLDWKTDKDTRRDSEHRRQLEVYRRAYAEQNTVPLENIKVEIGFIGLRKKINLGVIETKLDAAQPRASAFTTFQKHANAVLAWKRDPELLLKQLAQKESDELLWKSIVEQYQREADPAPSE
ncbi:ATP-dependent helicase [Candidatus Micrarchaeota archaeon]|nr:ATP-dependent helicase [Candidatus Micrarchaeota archaeon]